ncbi:MAG: YajQ family cyclic di-GMP-binding protein [Alphaproteobacteria bacterium]|uniref:Nucleotide-binding protein DBW71_02260 n=1 Tax=PS1 clade bacterium TaxID=2175152 RepID=A0A368DRR4_9PROT|nr:YajQ family cyclic di-GMP-binding protein [Rhodobiaceae bacterium]OUT75379.1 MAG: YajQ family cyclic di-GMP-binding protein [Rhizobiales bacterium TMED25]RCL73915.1 MAG: YajQ family cyclic di-GMP-binding protein [PS1 clade bacterium]|tara:strand:- start:4839 stop:5324 length:486 start_codon:yes stop_codon:yes gene_type:complete
MPTFDIVSKFEVSEIDNALQNLDREISQRYDFKSSKSEISLDKNQISISTDDEYKLTQLQEMLKVHLTKRGIDAKVLEMGKIESAAGQSVRQIITLIQGINRDLSKQIIQMVKESKIKVQISIQGEDLRVSGKKRDELQDVISLLKENEFNLPLQFINFRD